MISGAFENGKTARDFGALYRRLGYKPFRMNRFEEYSLYAENRSFLVCDSVITFNDRRGRLMALKPDVTLSIAKSCRDDGATSKLYYDENVYRLDEASGEFREIMQSGLECMGVIDLYSECEVLELAVRSLELISADCALDVSHVGIPQAAIADAGIADCEAALALFAAKNAHGLRALCAENGVPSAKADALAELAQLYGSFAQTLTRMRALLPETALPALAELERVYEVMQAAGAADKLRLDLSVISDMSYYNGVIFRGFVNGISRAVLSGGRYDNLLKKLGKNAQAIGFAVYRDALTELDSAPAYDADVLLLCGDAAPEETVRAVKELNAAGKSVRVSRERAGLRCREVKKLVKGAIEDA